MINAKRPLKNVSFKNPIVNNQPINHIGPIIPATSTFLLIILSPELLFIVFTET